MIIIIMNRFNGVGGQVQVEKAIHCHFENYKRHFDSLLGDNLFFRHLSVYLLDKYFRKTDKYQNRHIPAPLGEIMGTNELGNAVPIGMVTEHVYGSEVSTDYYEHLDWDTVSSEFAEFGFTKMDHDYCSGFSGESDSIQHNHIRQDDLFPGEQKKTFASPKGMPWIKDRYSTARWMRIDFENASFPFEKVLFLKNIHSQQTNLKEKLSPSEFYFLTQYALILQGKTVADKSVFDRCIQEIRTQTSTEIYQDQVEYLKRKVIGNQLSQAKDEFLRIDYNMSVDSLVYQAYLIEFQKALKNHSDDTLESLRKWDKTNQYLEHDQVEVDEHISTMIAATRKRGLEAKINYPFFFKPPPPPSKNKSPESIAIHKAQTSP